MNMTPATEPSRDAMGLHNVPGPLDARCRTGRYGSTGTANWATFSEITFSFRFGPAVLLRGGRVAPGRLPRRRSRPAVPPGPRP